MWKNAKFCKEVQNKKYERQKNNCRGFYRRNNMTDEEYIEVCAQKAREEARETLKHSLRPFERVKESFRPVNMSNSKFNKILRLMETEVVR